MNNWGLKNNMTKLLFEQVRSNETKTYPEKKRF